MADNNEDSLIGYDPLAWIREADNDANPTLTTVADVAEAMPLDSTDQSAGNEFNTNDLDAEVAVPTDDTGTTVQIILEPVQSIQTVAKLHERLMEALQDSHKIEIDASAVTTIDTATLQLLLIFKQTAMKQMREISIDFPSERFIEAAELLGLAEMLEVDQAASGFF